MNNWKICVPTCWAPAVSIPSAFDVSKSRFATAASTSPCPSRVTKRDL